MFKIEIYDIPAEEIDVDDLATTVGVSSDDVKADGEDLRGGRPGVRITCRENVDLDIEQLTETVAEYLSEEK